MSKDSIIEYWFDTHHTGCLRIIDHKKNVIYGSDPAEKYWQVKIIKNNGKQLTIDYYSKKTHIVNKIMTATYVNRRNDLVWSDGNVWKRIRMDPHVLLNHVDKIDK